MMRLCMALVLAVAARAEIRDVIRSAEIDALAAKTTGDRALHERPNFAVWLQTREGKARPPQTNPDFDSILHIRKGRASLQLGGRTHTVGAGDVVHVPRGTAWQLDPGGSRIEWVAVRIFPTGENLPARRGLLTARRMPDVLPKSEIDATIARSDANQPIHSSPGYTMNYVIYSGRSGPYESHRGCVDIYFMQSGTGAAHLGGTITNPREESPGEIRGDGVTGSRTHQVGPGDMVVIPRDGVHHVVPTTPKLAYLLLKVWAE
jgi:quercetin dioxygenase-like cupin family protein